MSGLGMIWAQDVTGVLGADGGMLWRVPADFAHFKATTMGCGLVMGRATWESLGGPLPGRRNVVLTRDRSWRAEGAIRAGSLREAWPLSWGTILVRGMPQGSPACGSSVAAASTSRLWLTACPMCSSSVSWTWTPASGPVSAACPTQRWCVHRGSALSSGPSTRPSPTRRAGGARCPGTRAGGWRPGGTSRRARNALGERLSGCSVGGVVARPGLADCAEVLSGPGLNVSECLRQPLT